MTVSLVLVIRDLAKKDGIELTPVVLETTAGIAGLIATGALWSLPAKGHPAEGPWHLAARAVSHADKIGISIREVRRCLREDFKP